MAKGWFEDPDYTGKAPEHRDVALGSQMRSALRKPVKRVFPMRYGDFRLDASLARNIAETAWGRGGTDAMRTNRRGVYFFSCSAHGGYVVDGKALTSEEVAKISQYMGERDFLNLLVGEKTDWAGGKPIVTKYILGYHNPQSIKRKKIRYPSIMVNVRWEKYPVYLFEEDCDWSVLENLTDIRVLATLKSPTHEQAIKDSFKWCHIKTVGEGG